MSYVKQSGYMYNNITKYLKFFSQQIDMEYINESTQSENSKK